LRRNASLTVSSAAFFFTAHVEISQQLRRIFPNGAYATRAGLCAGPRATRCRKPGRKLSLRKNGEQPMRNFVLKQNDRALRERNHAWWGETRHETALADSRFPRRLRADVGEAGCHTIRVQCGSSAVSANCQGKRERHGRSVRSTLLQLLRMRPLLRAHGISAADP
jgi:hypothetical protein